MIAVAVARLHRRVDDQRQHVDLAHRFERDVHHPHVQPVRRLVHARCVDEHHLPIRIVLHANDACARRLRLVGDDGELLADDAVEQRGLAGVRPAEERDETGFHQSPEYADLRRLRGAPSALLP